MKLRARSAFLCSLLVCFAASSALSQSRVNSSGTGGINTIKGRIYTSDGKTIDTQIKVRIESQAGSDLTLITDQTGGFVFQNMSPGSYTVVVDAGDWFQIFRETVSIDPDAQVPNTRGSPPTPHFPKVFTVPVYLQSKGRTASKEKTGVINAKYADAPEDAVKHYEKGLALVRADKLDEALAEFKQAIAIYPGLEPAYVEAGKIYLKKSKLEDAINVFRTAIRYDPKDFDAKLNYAVALYNAKQLDDAQKELTEAAALNASAVWPHYYLGMIFIQRKDYDDAQMQLEAAKLLKGDKNIPLLHRYLGGIYAAKKLNSQAIAELEKYIQLSPNAQDADRIRQTIAELRNNKN